MLLKNWLSRASLLACFGLLVFVSSGCLETGVGDPEQAKADSRINGVWAGPEDAEYMLVRNWDARTHVISSIGAGQVGGKPQYRVGQSYKAWLATVDGVTYINIDYQPTSAQDIKDRYGIAKLVIKDDTIDSYTLNDELVKRAKNSDELIKLLREKKDDPKLFNDVVHYKRAPADVVKAIAKG